MQELLDDRSKDGNSSDEDELQKFSRLTNDKEDVSEPIEERLAEIINQLWQRPQTLEKFFHILQQYLRPQNCEKLRAKNVTQKYGVINSKQNIELMI